jgi:hypothetical protein
MLISNVEPICLVSNITNWDELLKKEARGINDYDLGEIHEVEPEIVVTKKGIVDKDKFYLPKRLVERFDGDKVWFSITKEDAQNYRKD